jgi:hypothetical protein
MTERQQKAIGPRWREQWACGEGAQKNGPPRECF